MVCLPIPPRRRTARILLQRGHRREQRGTSTLRPSGAHLGMSPALLPDGALGTSVAPSLGASFGASLPASCGIVLISPPLLSPFGTRWLVPLYASPIVARKNTVARTPVLRERKLADPVAPNRLPEAPPPNAAP